MAAGLFRWRGDGAGTKSAWNDGRNWVDGAGTPYAQARYPGSSGGDNDSVELDVAISGTAQALAGYDTSGLVALASFVIGRSYDQPVGSSGNKLILNATRVVVDARASGDIYLQGGNITNLIVSDVKSDSMLYLSGSIRSLFALKGKITAENTWASSNEVVVGYSGNITSDVTLTIPATGNAPSNGILQYGGVLDISVAAGLTTAGGSAALRAGGGAVVLLGNTPVVTWNAGNITSVAAWGGQFVASTASAATITTLKIGGSADVNLNNGTGNITVTNLAYLGGRLTRALEV